MLCCSGSNGNQSPSFASNHNNSSTANAWGSSYSETHSSSGPVVFVSTCEMAATLQPWLDAGAQIERVSKNREGYLDLDDLSRKLAKHQNSARRLVGLFSSASRLTGILADDVATTILLHQHGAISIWDYSHGAPFAPIMTNSPLPGANKDVVFFSTNKFVGGVQAPGELNCWRDCGETGKGLISKQHCQVSTWQPAWTVLTYVVAIVYVVSVIAINTFVRLDVSTFTVRLVALFGIHGIQLTAMRSISGVLVIKKNLLSNLNAPTLNDSVGVVVTVRAGLVIQLKESLGGQNIMNRLERICK